MGYERGRLIDAKVETTGQRVVEQALADGTQVADLTGMRLRWYTIGETRGVVRLGRRAQGTQGSAQTEASVYVYDDIGGSLGVTAGQFKDDLAQVTADVIHLRINSPGGSVKDALAIMNTLRAHPARVVAHVDGWAASAASIVMLGGDEIVVEPGGEVMVHMASTELSGDPTVLREYADWLDRQSQNVAELYAQRSKLSPSEWLDLMRAETWLYGREAVDLGLVDRAATLDRPADGTAPPAPQPMEDVPPDVAVRMARRHDVSKRYRYNGRVESGAPRRTVRSDDPGHYTATDRETGGSIRRRVPSEVRDAGRLRRRAMDRGMVRRDAPAGITTNARRSAPAGDIAHEVVELRGRQMFRTHGAFTVYGRGYEMWDMCGPYVEKVYAGSGAQTINARDLDCIFLENHIGTTMARTAGPWNDYRGTLNLREDPGSGWHEAYLSMTREDTKRVIECIDDRLITEMSYAFFIVDGRWNDDMTEFGIYLYDMHRGDVSAVNYGANPYTDISARASEILGELEQMPAGAIREAVRILSQRVDSYERILRDADPGAMARVVEPALTRGEETTSADRVKAAEWALSAFREPEEAEPAEPVEDEPEQAEQPEIIDKTPADGPTVAGYEALLESMGIQPRP